MTRWAQASIPRSKRGAAMLAALCFAAVFAISLSSYLSLCFTSLNISSRNLMQSRCSEVSELGVEQALYAMNNSDWTNWTMATNGLGQPTATAELTLTSNGLVPTSTAPTPLYFGNGAYGTVNVTVTNYVLNSTSIAGSSPGPSITAQASVVMPSYAGGSSPAAISASTTYSASAGLQSGAAPLFVNAVSATAGRLRFRNAGTADSYNSNPPATSLQVGASYTIAQVGTTNWVAAGAPSNVTGTTFTATATSSGTGTAYAAYQPLVSGMSGYSAVLEAQDTATGTASVLINNAVVHGFAVGYDNFSPATTNWFSYGGLGMLVGPNTSAAISIDSTRLMTESTPYQPIFLELPTSGYPFTSALPLPSSVSTDTQTLNRGSAGVGGTVLGTALATSPAIYQAGNGITLGNNQIVTINGPVVIVTYGGIFIAGTGGFELNTPQASLQIFDEYGNISITGSVGITYSAAFAAANPNLLLPKKVAICATNNTWSSCTIGTAGPSFYGVIYLPYMPITISNGATAPIYGSIVGRQVTFSGSPTIHYDLALRSPTTSYTQSIPSQYGAAFDNLSTPITFGSVVASSP